VTLDGARLMELLPAVYRLRDAEAAARVPGGLLTAPEAAELAALEAAGGPLDPTQQRRLGELRAMRERGPLAALLDVIGGELAVLEENLAQLYDDQFIETAAPWAVPYIGDLIGYRTLHDKGPRAARRAEVAHTIGFRRRKGTASMLEQLARDVTGWNARVVEYFAFLATNQSMNHRRPTNLVRPGLRDGDALEAVGGAFDPLPRTLDVRRIERGRGRYNVPNIGIFLWRIDAQRLEASPAAPDPADATGRRFRFSPLGNDVQLHTRPEREDEISHLAEPINVPEPITRRRLKRQLDRYYGPERSLLVQLDALGVPASDISVCDLSDAPGGWAHEAPLGQVAVDPLLGRLALASDLAVPARVLVTWHYGAPGEFAGGEYARLTTFAHRGGTVVRVPDDQPTIQAALAALGGEGTVEIVDSGRYVGPATIDVAADKSIELRAADGRRPTLVLSGPLTVRGGAGSRAAINGIVIAGDRVDVPSSGGNGLRALEVTHATLVPGVTLAPDGTPSAPGDPSITVALPNVELSVTRSILGALRIAAGSRATVVDSILDAGAQTNAAYAAPGGQPAAGGPMAVESSTVIGAVLADSLEGSNAIFLGRVEVTRRQEGCLRFSFAPADSIVPRRHRCQPGDGEAAGNVPHFASLRYGFPTYCRLAPSTPDAITRGAEDESEMGVFRWRYEPQRHADLLTRLDEYLRVGLSAGIFHAS
jgi:hypothetical protein